MHYKRYIVRDGVPVMPDTTSAEATLLYAYYNGTQFNINKKNYDVLDFGFIIESIPDEPALNACIVKCFCRIHNKNLNRNYEGVSAGFRIAYGRSELWPVLTEV